MNFSLVKNYKKKFKPLPWACYAIMTEYVGLFFILSNFSIQSTFLLFCKILVCVVFAVAKKTPYRGPTPWASITILSLSQLRLVSFYSDLFFFFTIMFSSSKLKYSRLYFPFIYAGTKMCLNFKFCEKRGNTDLRAGAKLTT